MRKPLALVGAVGLLIPPGAAGAQMRGLATAEVAAVARARALDYRMPRVGVVEQQRLVPDMIVSREIAANARVGLGLAGLYGRKKANGEFRVNGGPRSRRSPAVTFQIRF